MLPTFARSLGDVAHAIKSLLPKDLPPSLNSRPGTLYEILSRRPDGGVGRKVHQTRWSGKQIEGSYWLITSTKFKDAGKHGKAWGQLYWKGKLVNSGPTRISGGLKYRWAEGVSFPNK
ncbi:hypothetical protein BDQ17DRAFT_1206195, partial [Cyathus striatus]